MSWLLFMDESGHDHKNMPLEVRGGVAIHASRVWDFVLGFHSAERDCFGEELSVMGTELKGSKLLDLKRVQWSKQEEVLDDNSRRKGVQRFITKTQQSNAPSRREFTAYGQASILMAKRVYRLLEDCGAVLFAGIIPRGVKPPKGYEYSHFLRKDQIFMQERFYWFLESKQESGLFVMDQSEKQNDRRYIRRLQDYYKKTEKGRQRSKWVVPSPLFVDSELSPGVQAADLCLYCLNWGFRRYEWDFRGQTREDIAVGYAGLCGKLQFSGDAYDNENVYRTYGIVFVPDPYTGRGTYS